MGVREAGVTGPRVQNLMSEDRDIFGDIPEDNEAVSTADAPNEGLLPALGTPEPEGEAAPAEPSPVTTAVPVTPPPGFVPQQALDEARRRERETAQELERLRQAQNPSPQAPAYPDPVEDPAGFQQWQEQREASITWQAVTSTSMMLANQAHTPQVVQEAAQAFAQECEQKPWLVQELRRQPHPYEWVVTRHKREQALANVTSDDLAAFQEWRAAQAAVASPSASAPAAAVPQQAAPKRPPPSLAAAPSAGGIGLQVVDEDEGTVFAKKG